MTAPVSPALAAARAYVAKGIAVFPVVAWDAEPEKTRSGGTVQPGKSPASEKGLKDATTDAQQVETWFSRNAALNIGIATGEKAGFWVLDIDGPEGAATLAALEAEHGALPETPEQTTARGRHICFQWDGSRPIRNSASRVGAKIDVRGEGGYIVAAPSRHATGIYYTWHPERRPSKMGFAPAPEWLIALAEKKPEPQRAPAGPRPDRASAPAQPGSRLITPYGEKILREECEKIATAVDGTVEVTLNSCSFNVGTIVGAGEIKEEIARAALIEAGLKVVKPPWTIVQISEKVERAMSAGIAKPRQKPELPPRRYSAPQARPTQQEKPAEQTATIVDIRQPDRGYTPDTAWERDIIRNEDGKIVARTKNAILFLMNHRDIVGALAYDTFARTPVLVRRPPWELTDGTEWEVRALGDNDVTWATAWLESKGLAMKASAIHAACIAAAQRNSFNPAADWLCDLKWDGKERLSGWLAYYLGATSENPATQEYIDTVGRKWLIGAVARILRSGCKMDTMLILEGEQGIGKSQAARILGTFGDRSYFTDEISDIGSKDAAMQLQGVAIVEIAELNAFGRADINALKAWLTRTIDRYRPPYGRMVIEAPRQSTLIGSMNPDGSGYFQDATGARRFWPVLVTSCDHAALKADQPQLWAEAVSAFHAGESWWLDDGDLLATAKKEQAARYADDPWGEAIDRYTTSASEVRVETLMGDGCLDIPVERRNAQTIKRVAKHLKTRGWVRIRKWDAASRSNKWVYRKGSSEQQQPEQGEIDL